MKTTYKIVSLLAAVLAAFAPVPAGSLDPPGPPAPTMVTLQQIYDRQHGSDTCFDNSGRNRFVECGATSFGTSNGAVKDVQTGLVWLKDASCIALTNWADASIKAATLASGQCGLTDGSKAGDWRLPTSAEWGATVKPSCFPSPGAPTLPDKLGTGCYVNGTQWATGVLPQYYWSSTDYNAVNPEFARVGNLGNGASSTIQFKASVSYVWPVRGNP